MTGVQTCALPIFREDRPGWVKMVKKIVLRHVVPQAAGALVTGHLAREHILRYGARPDRVVVFPNTIDVDALAARADELRRERANVRKQLGIEPADVAVLQVGRLIPMKGADILIRAIAFAQPRVDERIHLILAGDGPERAGAAASAAGPA